MTAAERVQALMDYRFTERQARFLELVMRHAGVCVPRQYARFAGIARGSGKSNALFAKLVTRGHAVETDCVHNRARLYRVHSRRLYHAIDEPNSRYRRAVPARAALERLMILDAVLATPNLDWLTTDSEKTAYVAKLKASDPIDGAAETLVDEASPSPETFPGTNPIGLDSEGRAVLLYLATVPWTDDFRRFLQGHAALLRLAPAWTLRLVFPRPVDHAYEAYRSVVREELETPLHETTIREIKWYFEHRQTGSDQRPDRLTQSLLDKGAQVFDGPRFRQLYRRWLAHGDRVFETVSAPSIAAALAAGTARVECLVLPHAYRHLAPVVDHDHSARPEVEKGFRRRTRRGTSHPHGLNPGPEPPRRAHQISASEQCARDWQRLVDAHKADRHSDLRG